jgi:hypothetical protein
VKCIYQSLESNVWMFEYYPTNRLTQMRQTILEKDSRFLSISLSSSKEMIMKLSGKEIHLHSMITIPKHHIIQFIMNYLLVKEKQLNGMTSCFFYHAAVTIPQSLIYAGEILCVLVGSKPAVLVKPFVFLPYFSFVSFSLLLFFLSFLFFSFLFCMFRTFRSSILHRQNINGSFLWFKNCQEVLLQ